MATLIHPDGRRERLAGSGPRRRFTLQQLQEAVGGFIEILDRWVPDAAGRRHRLRLVIDEEGKLKGLPVNPYATAMMKRVLFPQDRIVGRALLMERGDRL